MTTCRRLPDYRELSAKDEEKLMVRHLYRVTDTCIPEDVAVLPPGEGLARRMAARREARANAYFPHEFLYRILLDGKLEQYTRSTKRTAGC